MKHLFLCLGLLAISFNATAKSKPDAPRVDASGVKASAGKLAPKDDCGINHNEICRVPAENPTAAPADPISAVLPKVEQPKPAPAPTASPSTVPGKKKK